MIIRPSALGDVARSVGALVSLRRAFPHAKIDWLVRDSFADVVRHHPMLDAVVPFPRKRLQSFWWNPGTMRLGRKFLRNLRDTGYEAIYDLQGLYRSALFSRATRADRRVGFANQSEVRIVGRWCYTHRYHIDTSWHTVDRMLGLLEADGIRAIADLRLYTGETDRQWAAAWLNKQGIGDGRYAIIAPTNRWATKRWPIDQFAALGAELASLGIGDVVVVGSPGEEGQVEPLWDHPADSVRFFNAVGQTSVGQLMALIQRGEVLIGNDSGALHMAIGLGRRAVSIFGPTDPQRVGPYRYTIGTVTSDQQPTGSYRARGAPMSITQISIDDVGTALRRVMDNPPPDPSADSSVPSSSARGADEHVT